MTDRKPPVHAQYMRRQHVAWELGITRHTLARLIANDASFPKFFAITAGIEVIDRGDFARWVEQKRLSARAERITSPK